jgi:hypothetical protein
VTIVLNVHVDLFNQRRRWRYANHVRQGNIKKLQVKRLAISAQQENIKMLLVNANASHAHVVIFNHRKGRQSAKNVQRVNLKRGQVKQSAFPARRDMRVPTRVFVIARYASAGESPLEQVTRNAQNARRGRSSLEKANQVARNVPQENTPKGQARANARNVNAEHMPTKQGP